MSSLAVLLIAIPLLAAFVSILSKKIAPYLLLAVSLVNVLLLFYFVPNGIVVIGGYDLPYGINLFVDAFSRIGLGVVNVLFLIVVLLNIVEFKKFSSILLVALAGLNGLLLTGDLFNLFVFLEVAGIAAYLITTSNKKPLATFRYLIIGSVGSSLYLFGLIILYGMFGTLNLMDMVSFIQANNVEASALVLPATLMFIGLGVEAKLLPFNSWVKGVLKDSNTLSGPMIAAVYAATISFVFGRIINNLLSLAFVGNLLIVVLVLLAVGIFIAEAMAFSSTKVREILLYSSIAQASIVVLLFVNGIVLWAVYLIIANALSKTVMFLVANKAAKDHGSDESESLQGIFSKNILVGITFSVATLSVMGLPLFFGFVVKLNYLTELALGAQWAILAVILISSIIEGIYFVRMLIKLWYPEKNEVNVTFDLRFKVVFVAIALILLALGTYTAPLNTLDNSIDTIAEVIDNG